MEIQVNKLKDLIKKINQTNILVVGDLALDEMVYGDTERISREAPVLILQHTHTKYILGSASNAAHNVAKLNNGNVSVVGVVGEDYQANDMRNAFKEAGIDTSTLIVDSSRKTITKTRISGSCSHSITQQIVRIDRQTNSPLSVETENKIIDKVKELISKADVVILSDYHIGTLSDRVISEVIELANKYSKKVIVDAQRNLEKYVGAYSMTPNLPDTQKHVGFELSSKEDFLKAGNMMLNQTNAEAILITCGADGMVVVEKNNKYTHIPVFNKSEVFDVTGAGDTVTATYSLALAIGATPVEAAVIGNIAAGIVVKQFGCATTNIEEILNSTPEMIQVDI